MLMSRLLLIVLLAGMVSGCAASTTSQPASTSPALTPFDQLTFHTTTFHLGSWPSRNGPMSHAKQGPRDKTGVRMVDVNGVLYDAPVIQAQDGAGALLNYATDQNPDDLSLAEKDAQRLIDKRVTNPATNDAWWFPYPFPYALYGDPHDTVTPPWYSGMAQGEAVYLFTRLYEITHD